MNERLRQLPSVNEVVERLKGRWPGVPHSLLVGETRRALEEIRKRLLGGSVGEFHPERMVECALAALTQPSLRHVINATGVVLHTNLGRAPLAPQHMAGGYSNLEYDLDTAKRGKRDTHLSMLLDRLLGTPAIVVNNNAAGVYLVLHELAAGAEVIVSRGELIEIGDGFRIPDIMQRAGVILKEVGTTNRTRIDDYRAAITDRTKLLLIVHPSNFRIQGFTGHPSRKQMVALARETGVAVYEDLGSGCMLDLRGHGINEPTVQDCLSDGVDIVSFSGDKLMGGPQSGIIAGKAELVARIRRNPMFRAFRLDKMIIEVLETTLRHLVMERFEDVPALGMIRMPAEQIKLRAERLIEGISAEVVPGVSVIGGGSTPEQSLPSWLISLPSILEKRLRAGNPPIIGRIEDDRLLLDLRTVLESEEPALRQALLSASGAIGA
jgi:L-seryl-tRNA(Ser) seleniumtransferase